MGAVSAWLLSITGVILLSVLAEFVLPEGQMNKYTKVIFSFVILLVIIMPLPKLFGKDFDISKFFWNRKCFARRLSLSSEFRQIDSAK